MEEEIRWDYILKKKLRKTEPAKGLRYNSNSVATVEGRVKWIKWRC